ncbi:MAG: hypothetical protein ACI89L_000618 [Phycisphaerales bacterium]
MLNRSSCLIRSGFFRLAPLSVAAAFIASPASGQTVSDLVDVDFQIFADDGGSGDRFGYAVAIDEAPVLLNPMLLVGAPDDDDKAADAGAAYVMNADTAEQLQKLLPNDGAAGDHFGHSVDVDGGLFYVAGAPMHDANGADSGAVYVYGFLATQIAKVLPFDGAAGDWFGWSVAADNGVVAVGAPGNDDNGFDSGAAYLFDAATGGQLTKLLPSDGTPGDQFGWSIAIDSGIVAVGAHGTTFDSTGSGSVYLFDAATGAQLAKLQPDDLGPSGTLLGDYFGYSVAISNNTVVVGALTDSAYAPNGGSAYLFNATTGSQITKIVRPAATLGGFGYAVAIHNDRVVIGAVTLGTSPGPGSAFVFDSVTGDYIKQLVPSPTSPVINTFGYCVSIYKGTATAGAWGGQDLGMVDTGLVMMFDLCPADLNGDGFLDGGDITIFVALFLAGDLKADLNGDSFLDGGDITIFVALFLAGC